MQGADAVINESEINRRKKKKIAEKGRRYKDIIQQHENKFKIAEIKMLIFLINRGHVK